MLQKEFFTVILQSYFVSTLLLLAKLYYFQKVMYTKILLL